MPKKQKSQGKSKKRRCRARDPRRCRCPRPQVVRCPVCGGTYRAVYDWARARRHLRLTLNYPPLICCPCEKALKEAQRRGGSPSEHRNPEQACC